MSFTLTPSLSPAHAGEGNILRAFGEACRVWPKPDPSAALPVFAELLTYVPLMEIMTDMAHMARFYGDTYAPTLSESLQTELARAARRATRAQDARG